MKMTGVEPYPVGDGELNYPFVVATMPETLLRREAKRLHPLFLEGPLRFEDPGPYEVLRLRTSLTAGEQFGSKQGFRQLTEAKKIAIHDPPGSVSAATCPQIDPVCRTSPSRSGATCRARS